MLMRQKIFYDDIIPQKMAKIKAVIDKFYNINVFINSKANKIIANDVYNRCIL
jgi:hypothetical protein